jgi:uncharacterized protein YcbK (DUF882 family)
MARYDFAPHFSEEEFTCQCGCGTNNVNRPFLERLERGRIRAERAFPIVSGCRCQQHNEDEGGVDSSSHLAGLEEECYAADIGVRGSRGRGIILPALVGVGFNRFGIANSFVHVDIDPELPPNMVWLY